MNTTIPTYLTIDHTKQSKTKFVTLMKNLEWT